MSGLPVSAELVARLWIGSRPGFSDAMVGATLPADTATWAALGFVQVTNIGGPRDLYTPRRESLVQIDTWANSPTSGRPPIHKAAALAEMIVRAAHPPFTPVQITPSGSLAAYSTFVVAEVHVARDPSRRPADEGRHARYSTDLRIWWVET